MLAKSHRMILYAFVIVAIAVTGALITTAPIKLDLGVTLAVLCLIFFAIVESYLGLARATEPQMVDVIYGEEELKKVYKSMRAEASKMSTIWCTRYADVQKYFKDERADFDKNERLVVRRLINPDRVNAEPKDFDNHVKTTQDLVKGRRYEIKATDIEEVECVICDYQQKAKWEAKALFVFNDQPSNTPRLGILLDPSKNDRISFAVEALKSWFDKEWGRASPIIPLEE